MDLIINVDGGCRGNPGPGASAWVIKDAAGKALAKEGVFFKECTNNQAEFTALEQALKKAAQLGGKRLDIKSDSLLLVKQYTGEYKIKNQDLRQIMEQIRSAAAKFTAVKLSHVPREQNKEADEMCNITMDKGLGLKSAKTGQVKTMPAKKAPVQLELFELDK